MNEIMPWALGVPVVLIVVHLLLWQYFAKKGKEHKENEDDK
ncbi:MAG: hypothetical protein R8M14_05235 [Ghiorsea sp.]